MGTLVDLIAQIIAVLLAHQFVGFAEDPRPATAERVPFADEVHLGLGPRLHSTVPVARIATAESWILEPRQFRGWTPPFSALATVADAGELDVTIGPHPHCAAPPQPAPRSVARMRRVSVQPAAGSIDSCLDWFTVDLFVTRSGEVAAVTLDLWEP
jgi:hypothetical protein